MDGEGDRRAWSSWSAEAPAAHGDLVQPVAKRAEHRQGLLVAVVLVCLVAVGAAVLRAAVSPDETNAGTGTAARFFSDAKPLGEPAPLPTADGPFRFLSHQGNGTGDPVAYDPCFAIHYVVRPEGAPPGGGDLLTQAVAAVSRATGLVFVEDGPTDEAPSPHRGAYRLSSSVYEPVLVVWSTEAESPDLRGDVLGFAGSAYIEGNAWSTRPAPGTRHYVSGQVVLDGPDLTSLLSTPGGRRDVRAVIMHELAHLVGLAHVPDPSQLMFRGAGSVTEFQAGDLRGLHRLGQGRCFVG